MEKGRTVGRYVLEERLGRGGMGEVWKAVDPQLRRSVAIKLLLQDEPDDLARFRREAETVAGLTHPNIAALYEFGEADGRPFIAMQFVDGAPLAPGKLAPRAAAEAIRAAAEAVAFAHGRGVVHRDLKPANIMIDGASRIYVMDFGLAKSVRDASLSASGMMIGTPSYMSPEQAMGRTRDIGPLSDVYGLGATLHALLGGRAPFEGDTLIALLGRVIETDPPRLPPSVPRDLATIALKAMEKDPARRYASARALADDLSRFLAGEAIDARPASITYRLGRRIRKHPVVFALTVLTTIAATVAVMTALRLGRERREAIGLLRVTASSSLNAALKLRRAGQNEAMADLLPPLLEAYKLAAERAPDDPEVDYLMGRMHRALLDDEQALRFQASALKKAPDYAPALYEWILLRTMDYRERLDAAVAQHGFGTVEGGVAELESRVPGSGSCGRWKAAGRESRGRTCWRRGGSCSGTSAGTPTRGRC